MLPALVTLTGAPNIPKASMSRVSLGMCKWKPNVLMSSRLRSIGMSCSRQTLSTSPLHPNKPIAKVSKVKLVERPPMRLKIDGALLHGVLELQAVPKRNFSISIHASSESNQCPKDKAQEDHPNGRKQQRNRPQPCRSKCPQECCRSSSRIDFK